MKTKEGWQCKSVRCTGVELEDRQGLADSSLPREEVEELVPGTTQLLTT